MSLRLGLARERTRPCDSEVVILVESIAHRSILPTKFSILLETLLWAVSHVSVNRLPAVGNVHIEVDFPRYLGQVTLEELPVSRDQVQEADQL